MNAFICSSRGRVNGGKAASGREVDDDGTDLRQVGATGKRPVACQCPARVITIQQRLDGILFPPFHFRMLGCISCRWGLDLSPLLVMDTTERSICYFFFSLLLLNKWQYLNSESTSFNFLCFCEQYHRLGPKSPSHP